MDRYFRNSWIRIGAWKNRHPMIALGVCAYVVFSITTLVYLSLPLLPWSIGHVIHSSGPGDGTAGFTWLGWVAHLQDSPVLHVSKLVNYPYGEPLWYPFYVTWIMLWIPFWLLARLTSSGIIAWNLMVYFGIVFSGVATSFVIKKLIGKSWVALLGGFAVVFCPYFQYKASVHLANVYIILFPLLIYAILRMWESGAKKYAFWSAAFLAGLWYTDGYYILIASVLSALLICSLVVVDITSQRSIECLRKNIKAISLFAAVSLVFALPLAYELFNANSGVSRDLSSNRGNVKLAAYYYGARPRSFLLPPPNTLLHQALGVKSTGYPISQEAGLFSGYMLSLFAITAFVLSFNKRVARRLPASVVNTRRIRVIGLTAIFLIPFMLPPYVTLFGHQLGPTPVGVIVHFTALWRVFTRFFIPFQILLVFLASYAIAYFATGFKIRRGKEVALAVLLCLVVVIEFMPSSRSVYNWDYDTIPSVYSWLKSQKDIKTIAEYPIDDPPAPAFYANYLTYQQVAGKNLINSSNADSKQKYLRMSIRGPLDAQTIPVLRSLGADALVIHGYTLPTDVATTQGLRLVNADIKNETTVYSIGPGPKASAAVELESPADLQPIVDMSSGESYARLRTSLPVRLVPLSSQSPSAYTLSFTVQYTEGSARVELTDGQNVIWMGTATQVPQTVTVKLTAQQNNLMLRVPREIKDGIQIRNSTASANY